LLVGGCSLTPTTTPSLPTPPARYAEAGQWVVADTTAEGSRSAWWSRFEDPVLNDLQDDFSHGNPSLKIALDRLEEARQAARAAEGSLWPKLGLTVNGTRSRASADAPSYSPNRANPIDDLSAAVTLSYEVDLFGRVRANAAGARALAEAAAEDAAALELALRAELINDYFQIRAIDAQLVVLEQTVDADERALAITENLVASGAGMPSDIAQARSQLENTRSQLADARLRRAQADHALAVLLGHPPVEAHQPIHPLPARVSLPAVSPGQPSTLLQRRPDIAAALHRVESARAAVGLARSAYFPVFNLGAALGRESTRSDTWFTAPARFWSVTPAMVATLLDGGQRRAQTRSAVLALEESTENYRRTVLTAYQEVEDQLAAVRELDTAQASAEISADSAAITLSHALHRYEAGATSYLEVAVAQNALLNSRLTAITLQYRRIVSLTLLVRAMGGNWS
jgi:NodT family efflux transporter outer membrane factor (OMF) lipoprotein